MKILTRKETAARGAISLRHLERLIGNGEGPPIIRLGARRIGIAEEDLDQWLASRRNLPPGFKEGEAR